MADPLWESASDALQADRLLVLAMKEAFQGDIAGARDTLTVALDFVDRQTGTRFVAVANAEAAIAQAIVGETGAALDWAERALEDRGSYPWIEPLVIVLLLVGNRRQVEDLAAVGVQGQGNDRHHLRFVRAVVAVRDDDAASLSAAEALIAEASSRGRILDEVIWTIGLARRLPEGNVDRRRLMTRARERIDETRFRGLARFLEP